MLNNHTFKTTIFGAACLGISFMFNYMAIPLIFLGLYLIWGSIKLRNTKDIIAIYLGGITFVSIVLGWMATTKKGERFDDWIMLSLSLGAFWLILPLIAKLIKINLAMITLPLAFAVLELSYKYIWYFIDKSGWTMYELGNATVNSAIAQMADIGGGIFATMIVVFLGGCLIDIFTINKKYYWIFLAALLIVDSYGYYRFKTTDYTYGPTACLIPSRKFKDLDKLKYKDGIVVTSEGAAINWFDKDNIFKLSEENTVVMGTYTRDCNSLKVFKPDGKNYPKYDKIKLVPWSEFEPLMGKNKFLAGNNYPLYTHDEWKFGTQICYDNAYGNLVREYMKQKPDFFLVASTESHGPEGWVAKDMLANVQMRAIESRRAFVRNVSGGYSGIVDSRGIYCDNLPLYLKEFIVVGPIPIDNRTTLYSIWGDWFVFILSALYGIFSILVGRY